VSWNQFNNETILEMYTIALSIGCDPEFIEMIKEIIVERGLSINMTTPFVFTTSYSLYHPAIPLPQQHWP
jgi:hypothetical protein